MTPVLPHGPLQQLEENLWMVDGTTRIGALGRKMVIVKLASGGLFIHNAIVMNDASRPMIDALGKVEFILVPNRFHDMDAGKLKALYPHARLVGLPATAMALAKKLPSMHAIEPDEAPPPVVLRKIPGLKNDECVMEVASAGAVTLVYTDALFNLPNGRGFSGWIVKAIGSSGDFKMTPMGRMTLLHDKEAFRGYLLQQAARTDVKRIVVSHGTVIDEAASDRLRGAAERL